MNMGVFKAVTDFIGGAVHVVDDLAHFQFGKAVHDAIDTGEEVVHDLGGWDNHEPRSPHERWLHERHHAREQLEGDERQLGWDEHKLHRDEHKLHRDEIMLARDKDNPHLRERVEADKRRVREDEEHIGEDERRIGSDKERIRDLNRREVGWW
jgi:hypothetical protein